MTDGRSPGYRGRQVLAFISDRLGERGYVPSYSEIAVALTMTVPDVCNVVGRLERRGYLQRNSIGVRRKRGWHKPVIILTAITPTT